MVKTLRDYGHYLLTKKRREATNLFMTSRLLHGTISREKPHVVKHLYLCGDDLIYLAAIFNATRYGTGSLPRALSTVPPAVKQ